MIAQAHPKLKSLQSGYEPPRTCRGRLWVTGRNSHLEQIWSALPQIADIDHSREGFSVGPEGDICGDEFRVSLVVPHPLAQPSFDDFA
jgi:hypothetical protein